MRLYPLLLVQGLACNPSLMWTLLILHIPTVRELLFYSPNPANPCLQCLCNTPLLPTLVRWIISGLHQAFYHNRLVGRNHLLLLGTGDPLPRQPHPLMGAIRIYLAAKLQPP